MIDQPLQWLRERLPELSKCDRLLLEEGDVVVHAPGFEDRTLALFDVITPSRRVSAVLLDYRPFNEGNRLVEVKDRFVAMGVRIKEDDILVYDRFDPDDFEQRLELALLRHQAKRVVIDISTMSKLAILLILRVCLELRIRVGILYAEAEKYGPTKEEFEDAKNKNAVHQPSLQIFTGIYGVVRVRSLASVAMQGQPTAALVFMSFNDVLTQVLLNTVFPTRLFLINGRPPIHSWREEATAWIHDQVRREWSRDNPVTNASATTVPLPDRAVSTLDYRETVSLLVSLYWDLSANHRILLAPSGSKMQSVGCFLTKALHPDIHIEYPSPEGFMPEYSSGIAQHWYVDLGTISDLVAELSAVESRNFLELPIG